MRRRRMRLVTWLVVAGWVVPAVAWAPARPAGGAEAAEPSAGETAPAGATPPAPSADTETEWRTHMVTGERAYRVRDFARAEAELSVALKVAEDFGKDDPRLILTLGRLVQIYVAQGKHVTAIGPATRLLEAREETLGPKHLNVAEASNNLAGLYADSDKPAKAKPLLERALAICKADSGGERLQAIVLDNLGEVERDLDHLDAAESFAREGLALRKAQYGTNHRWYAKSLETLGTILLTRGEAAKAEETLRESLSIRRSKIGWNRPLIIRSLVHLADACKAQKKHENAENYYKQAIRMGEGGLGRNDDARAEAFEGYADLLRQTDRADEATEMADQAKTIRAALKK